MLVMSGITKRMNEKKAIKQREKNIIKEFSWRKIYMKKKLVAGILAASILMTCLTGCEGE